MNSEVDGEYLRYSEVDRFVTSELVNDIDLKLLYSSEEELSNYKPKIYIWANLIHYMSMVIHLIHRYQIANHILIFKKKKEIFRCHPTIIKLTKLTEQFLYCLRFLF